jgi:hypothetical protein
MVRNSSSPPVVGGSRNPFVLAEIAEGKSIDWESMHPHEVKNMLAATLHLPYEKLFSPDHESPLFRKKIELRRRRK